MTPLILVVLAAVVPISAHEGERAAAGPSSWDVAAIVLGCLAALLYVQGVRRLTGRRVRLARWQHAAFGVGIAAVMIAITPPLDSRAARLFSAHMIQHELLVLVGAPLIVAARPIVPWLWALPVRVRTAAGATLQARGATLPWRVFTHPLLAWAVHGLTLWLWHAPALYEAAVTSEAVHALQHAMFFGTSALFWWGLFHGRHGRVAYGASVAFVFTTMMHSGALGALFAFSSTPSYGVYAHRAAAAGIDAAADQQLAGLYMWIPAGAALTLIGLALLWGWMSESDRRARVHEQAARQAGR